MARQHEPAPYFADGIFFARPGSPCQRGTNAQTRTPTVLSASTCSAHEPVPLPGGRSPRHRAAAEQSTPQNPELAGPCPDFRHRSGSMILQHCDDHANPPQVQSGPTASVHVGHSPVLATAEVAAMHALAAALEQDHFGVVNEAGDHCGDGVVAEVLAPAPEWFVAGQIAEARS